MLLPRFALLPVFSAVRHLLMIAFPLAVSCSMRRHDQQARCKVSSLHEGVSSHDRILTPRIRFCPVAAAASQI